MPDVNERILGALIDQTGKVSELGTKLDSQKESIDRMGDSMDELLNYLRSNGNKAVSEAIQSLRSETSIRGAGLVQIVVSALAIFSTVSLAVIAGVKSAEALGLLGWFK